MSVVTRFIAHPDFNRTSDPRHFLEDDIALVFLADPINNIRFAQLTQQNSVPGRNARAAVAGWYV